MSVQFLKLIRPLHKIGNIYPKRNLSSFLFVQSKDASKTPSILQPQLEYLFNQDEIGKVKDSLKARNLFEEDTALLSHQYQQILELKSEIQRLENARLEIASETQEILLLGKKNEVESLRQKGKQIRLDIKSVSNKLKELEDTFVPKLLTLPNILHPTVPLATCEIQQTSDLNLPVFEFPPKSHVELGTKLGYLKFSNVDSGTCYTLGRLAALDLAVLDYFSSKFSQNGFTRFSNPDICKAVVLEGCGIDVNNPLLSFHLDGDKQTVDSSIYRLIGSASLPSFCAYYAKHAVRNMDLPLKHFATGRYYSPNLPTGTENTGLFNSKQSSQLYFYMAHSGQEAETTYKDTLDILLKCFNRLDVHYRVVNVCASKLLRLESRRTEIQMWSTSLKTYVPVSGVSDYGTSIAKRLWMCYVEKKKYGFTHTVCGNAVTTPTFLGCLIENLQTRNGDFEIPTVLQSCITKFS
ncbi:hypothetical protein CHUAL_007927 [Chamberlinius hualienensis]